MQISLTDQQLLKILDTCEEAYAIYTTRDIIIQTANKAMLRFWGVGSEVFGIPLELAVPELKGQPFNQMLQAVFDTGIDDKGIIPATTKIKGILQTNYYEYSYSAVRDDDGDIYAILHTARDVTDQVLNRKALSAAETVADIQRNRLYSFFMQAPVGIAILDGPEFTFELLNPIFQSLYPGKIFLGKKVFDVNKEGDDLPFLSILENVFHSGDTQELELKINVSQFTKPETKDLFFNFIFQARKTGEGSVDGIIIFAFEITEIFNAQKELKNAQKLLTLGIDASDIGIWKANMISNELDMDPRIRGLHGLSQDQQVSFADAMQLVSDQDRSRVEASLKNAVSTKGIFREHYWINPADGTRPRWLRSNGQAYYDTEGNPLYIAGTTIDFTEQKEDDIRKNNFISMTSHELKTPLTSLNGYLQVLQKIARKSNDTFTLPILDKSVNQIKKMISLINGFLNVSRLESGKINIEKTRFDITDLINEVTEESKAILKSHEIIFNAEDEISIIADHDKIGQVLDNLISNAIKYSPGGGIIAIHSSVIDDKVQVSVSDSGIGIKPHDQQNIFSRFYRVENHNSTIAGFGIGLYLCDEIIKCHNGKLWMESEYGKGSTFYFTLPLK